MKQKIVSVLTLFVPGVHC